MVVVGMANDEGYKEEDDDSQRVCRKLLPYNGETGEWRWEELSYLYAGIILSRGLQTDAFIARRFHALALDVTQKYARLVRCIDRRR